MVVEKEVVDGWGSEAKGREIAAAGSQEPLIHGSSKKH